MKNITIVNIYKYRNRKTTNISLLSVYLHEHHKRWMETRLILNITYYRTFLCQMIIIGEDFYQTWPQLPSIAQYYFYH